jgi:arsenate reductase-like glutaredoxin family protein
MSNIEWCYHRKNCNSCSKAADFFAKHRVSVIEQVDARTVPLVDQDALELIAKVNDLYVTRGVKVIHFDLLHERPDNASLLELLIGRSGKLRAPAIKVGKTLIVGFDQATYEKVLR